MARGNSTTTKTKTNVNFSDIRSGDVMAITSYVQVEDTRSRGEHGVPQINVRDVDTNLPFTVHGRDIIESAYSADRYTTTKSATKTQMAEILSSAWNRPFSVTFEKADGTPRVLRGRLVNPEPLMGRSQVQDFDAMSKGESGLRLVDHRTISQLTVDGVRYQLKAR